MRLLNDLKPIAPDRYEEAIDSYVKVCATLPGVRGIYQFGSVRAPGLSDIDLVVVLDDDVLTPRELARLSIKHESWSGNQPIAECFVHDVYLCSRSVFTQVEWLAPGNDWVSRGGVSDSRVEPTQEERRLIGLVHGLDFCIGRLQEFAHLGEGPTRSMRWVVVQLWSLTHTYSTLVREECCLEDSWSHVVTRLQDLRRADVSKIQRAQVEELIPDVIAHFVSAVDHFSSLLGENILAGGPGPARDCFLALHANRVVHHYASSARQSHTRLSAGALSRRIRIAGRTVDATWSVLSLPGVVLAHHLAYLVIDVRHSPLASRIARRARLQTEVVPHSTYRQVVARRQQLAAQSARPIRGSAGALSGFRIPGLPASSPSSNGVGGSWRFRAIRSLLDWRVLPWSALNVSD